MTQLTNPDAEYGISPESLEIAKTYLACNDTSETALVLGITTEKVSYYLRKPEIKRFIDTIFMEQGYMNRGKMQEVMDKLFEIKMEEMEDSEMGTSKDILDLMTLQHKMRMDEIAAEAKANGGNTIVKNQTNIQQNNGASFGPNYDSLLDNLNKAGSE